MNELNERLERQARFWLLLVMGSCFCLYGPAPSLWTGDDFRQGQWFGLAPMNAPGAYAGLGFAKILILLFFYSVRGHSLVLRRRRKAQGKLEFFGTLVHDDAGYRPWL